MNLTYGSANGLLLHDIFISPARSHSRLSLRAAVFIALSLGTLEPHSLIAVAVHGFYIIASGKRSLYYAVGEGIAAETKKDDGDKRCGLVLFRTEPAVTPSNCLCACLDQWSTIGNPLAIELVHCC